MHFACESYYICFIVFSLLRVTYVLQVAQISVSPVAMEGTHLTWSGGLPHKQSALLAVAASVLRPVAGPDCNVGLIFVCRCTLFCSGSECFLSFLRARGARRKFELT